MKIMQLSTAHPDYLRILHKKNINAKTHKQCIENFLQDYYWAGHILTPELAKLGYKTFLAIPVDNHSQSLWCQEHGIPLEHHPYFGLSVVIYQVAVFQPDILYITIPQLIDDKILSLLPRRPKLIIGWNASPTPRNVSWTEYDLMLSSHPVCMEASRKLGAKSCEYFFPGFPEEIATSYLAKSCYNDIAFSGYWTGTHAYRNKILYQLLQDLKDTKYALAYYLAFMPDAPEYPPEIMEANRGTVWGKAMYRAFSASKITLNAYTDLDEGPQNISPNMRQMEATGAGSLLLTQYSPNLNAFFEPDKDVVTFSGYKELKDKIEYYLHNEYERKQIALQGKSTCLHNFNMRLRVKSFFNYIDAYIQNKKISLDKISQILQAVNAETASDDILQYIINKAVFGDEKLFNFISKKLKFNPSNNLFGWNLYLAKKKLKKNDITAAIRFLKKELKCWPENDTARGLLSKIYIRQIVKPT